MLSGGDSWSDGVWAPPGRYRLVLEADGFKAATTLEVMPDPRVLLPATAYQQEFELARQIEALRTRVEPVLGKARPLLQAIAARGGEAPPRLQPAIAAAAARVSELSGVVLVPGNPANGWWLSPKGTHHLRYVSQALDALAEAVDGADAAPSPDARASFANLEKLSAAAIAAFEAFEKGELTKLDRQLAAAKLKPVGGG